MTKQIAPAAIALMLSLSGCATASKLASAAPSYTAKASRPVAIVADCIVARWAAVKGFTARTTREGDATLIVLGGMNLVGSDMVASVGDDGAVSFKARPGLWGGFDDDRRAEVQGCL